MKSHFLQRIFGLCWLLLPAIRLNAAADFDLSVTASPSPAFVNTLLSYTITVSNKSALTWTNVFVTNTLPASVTFYSATTNFSGTVTRSGQEIVFCVFSLTNNTSAQMAVGAVPATNGWITNVVIVAATNAIGITNNVVSEVFTAQADLGVTLTGLASGVLVNDWMTYALNVTNRGPGSAPNVVLSNRLPAGVTFIAVSPTNQAAFTNNSLIFSLGTLTNGDETSFSITLQPTNTGTLTISARVSAAGLLDTNPANDTVSSNFVVGDVLVGQLVATLVSTQHYNAQTGLMEQRILLSNEGTNDVPSARVLVSGLTNWLFNAVGTNDDRPFVVYGQTLAAGQSVELLLEIFVPSRQAVTNLDLQAAAVPLSAVSPPAGTAVHISRIVRLSSGDMLLEFPSVTGQRFTVLYCESPAFSTNVLVAQPSVVAPADRTQWIDNGPPRTISRAPETTMRFYRVLQNP